MNFQIRAPRVCPRDCQEERGKKVFKREKSIFQLTSSWLVAAWAFGDLPSTSGRSPRIHFLFRGWLWVYNLSKQRQTYCFVNIMDCFDEAFLLNIRITQMLVSINSSLRLQRLSISNLLRQVWTTSKNVFITRWSWVRGQKIRIKRSSLFALWARPVFSHMYHTMTVILYEVFLGGS